MQGLFIDKTVEFRTDLPRPTPKAGEALIKVRLAGICNTDMAIIRGYKNFTGVLGHEFVGTVVQADDAPDLVGKRVVAEINVACNDCETCRRGNKIHCPNRTRIGIRGHDGVMAEYITLPTHVLYPVSDTIPDESAVFVEPLAAACEITDRVHIRPPDRVIVLGDGKLGLLIAQVLQLTGCNLLVVGHHPDKLSLAERRGIATALADQSIEGDADVVIEATGRPEAFAVAQSLVRPRGTIVLKSLYQEKPDVDLAALVTDEITVVGSRSGPFPAAIHLLEQQLVDVRSMIHAILPLDLGTLALDRAAMPGVLKVLLTMASPSLPNSG